MNDLESVWVVLVEPACSHGAYVLGVYGSRDLAEAVADREIRDCGEPWLDDWTQAEHDDGPAGWFVRAVADGCRFTLSPNKVFREAPVGGLS